jgi:hypothetical protein
MRKLYKNVNVQLHLYLFLSETYEPVARGTCPPAPPPFGKILKSWIFSIEACIQMTFLCPRDEESGGILIYPCPSVLSSVRPDVDTWFVRLSPPTVLELQL